MHKNRAFTIEDVKDYARSKGYCLQFHRYKRVFTLRSLSRPDKWAWIYAPHTEDTLIELVDDLDFEGWANAVDETIKSIIDDSL